MKSVMMVKGRLVKVSSQEGHGDGYSYFGTWDGPKVLSMSLSDFFKDFFSPEKECFALIVED